VLKPEAHAIDEMDAAAVPDFRSAALRLSAEEDRAPENAPKGIGEPAIVFAAGGQAPVGQDLRGALETDYRTSGPDRLRCEPQQDEPILAKRNPVFGMADDLEKELPVSPAVGAGSGREPANGQSAQNKRPCAE
jgi:hypothetical protein